MNEIEQYSESDSVLCKSTKISPYIFIGINYNDKSFTTLENILTAVCILTGSNEAEIRSKSRKREYIIPRQIFCYAARKLTKMKYNEIGEFIGRDHSSIIHSCRESEKHIENNDKIFMEYFNKVKGIFNIKYKKNEKEM